MSTTTKVRHGDTHDVTWTINADLTGATMTGFIRLAGTEDDWDDLDVVVDTPGATSSIVKHALTGLLAEGKYAIVLRATIADRIATIPTEDRAYLVVLPNVE